MDRSVDRKNSCVCLVVPCYNEQSRFEASAFERCLASLQDVHFLLVNDGSRDGTLEVLEAFAARHPERVRVLDVQPNQGKAEAVRRGMQVAMGGAAFGYAGYWDADLATPLDAVEVFINVLDRLASVDIVFGARVALLGRHIERLPIRHYLGRAFATAASVVLSLPIYDTQCGAKLFRVNERCSSLFEAPFGSRWIFDVELVARYLLLKRSMASESTSSTANRNIGIYELPLDHWQDVGASKVKPLDFVRAIGEMAMIYRDYRYGQSRGQHWLLALVTAPFVRYAGAGAIGTAIRYGVLVGAVELAHASRPVGATAGIVIGTLINYFLNYNLTFASTLPHKSTLPRFLGVAALGVVLSRIVVQLLAGAGVHEITAEPVGILLVLVVGYALNKAWTFRHS